MRHRYRWWCRRTPTRPPPDAGDLRGFEDKDAGRFYLKFKDNALTAAIGYLREKGLFQDDSDSESGDNPAWTLVNKRRDATRSTS